MKLPVAALAATLALLALKLKVQPLACVTVKVNPAIVSVPVRGAPVFAAMLMPTAPLPVALAPLAIVSQLALLFAVHAQPALVVTLTLCVPALAPTLAVAALKLKAHPSACVTVKLLFATVMTAERLVPGFAAALKLTVPLPAPLVPLAIANHV